MRLFSSNLFLIFSILGTSGFAESTQYHKPKIKTEDTKVASVQEVKPKITFVQRTGPLADLLSSAEGDWNSVNRGHAGDTPGGIRSITGRDFAKMTVGEVISLQQTRIYAVGRYQMIPTTLRYAIKVSGTKHSELFTPEIQNRLFAALLQHKRPAIGSYLAGTGSLSSALDELAFEWAAVAYRNGYSYYSGMSGNRASITRDEAAAALREGRAL